MKKLEAMLVSPPEREELVVHLAYRDGGFWGEIYREDGVYKLSIESSEPLNFDADEFATVLALSLATLRERLE